MSWDYTTADSITVPSTANVNVDRAVVRRITIDLASKKLVVLIGVGVTDGVPGGDITNKKTLEYTVTDPTRFDAIMAVACNAAEPLLDALDRLLLTEAQADGIIPAGSAS